MIHETLQKIQAELKAPKDKTNSFGKYKYRSCESILESAKPVLAKYGASVTLSDKIELIGDRFYIRATASLNIGDEEVETIAYAREPQEKKGMDEPQVTGTASSYARKYALNGLFAIDDTKDADTDEYHRQSTYTEPDPSTSSFKENKKKEVPEEVKRALAFKIQDRTLEDIFRKKQQDAAYSITSEEGKQNIDIIRKFIADSNN